ncbi:hypothetical protein [Hydrogenophaga sp.]|uniref:hypothetical protein n=1 Tax=Hydrogenophaga sp. TaxID=1904254 RepID=UPI002627B30E|nr:hypothetical protein [Hydrogenophaga sp.]MCW5654293.1 hypothetical protein [Hydrogenophaga sp.]
MAQSTHVNGVTPPDALHPRLLLLAARADCQAASLTSTLNALIALERFVSVEHTAADNGEHGREERMHLRSSLGRLTRALHEDMQRRIGLVADTTTELRAVLEGSGRRLN